MRVYLQSGLNSTRNTYKNLNTVSFRGDKTNKDGNKKILELIPIKKSESISAQDYEQEYNDDYDSGYDEGYEAGYEDAKKDRMTTIKAALIGLAAIQAISLYGSYQTDKMNTTEHEILYKQNEIITEALGDLQIETNLGNKLILAGIADIIYMLDNLELQKDNLKAQIALLPEDNEEAAALKEELETLEEQYEALKNKYREYMSEYNKQKKKSEPDNTKEQNSLIAGT